MQLYLQNAYFKGRVLTISTDCSYSGCWVKEAMTFMDDQGVGPCGHAAKEKGILVKVYASWLMRFLLSWHFLLTVYRMIRTSDLYSILLIKRFMMDNTLVD